MQMKNPHEFDFLAAKHGKPSRRSWGEDMAEETPGQGRSSLTLRQMELMA